MKKVKLTLLFLTLAFASCADKEILSENAETGTNVINYGVTIDEAQKSLEGVLSDLYPETRTGCDKKIESRYTINKTATRTTSDSISKQIYVYNLANNGGFALMSSDMRLPDLLLLTQSGHLSENEKITDPELSFYVSRLNDYLDSYTINKENGINDGDGGGGGNVPPIKWFGDDDGWIYGEGGMEHVCIDSVCFPGGLCKTKWGQGDTSLTSQSFNMYCPEKWGYRTYAGCAPVALAQLMSYYKYPTSYNGYTFDWDKMIPITKDSVGTEGMKQVARLLQQLGLSENLNVKYGKDTLSVHIKMTDFESSTNLDRFFEAFVEFGYHGPFVDEWYVTNNVVTELKQGFPLLISGVSILEEDTVGHSWLGHGLLKRKTAYVQHNINGEKRVLFPECNWYVLCNPGWDGYNNGYYLSGVFDMRNPRKGGGPVIAESKTRTTSGDNNNYEYNLRVLKGIRK